VPKSTGFEFEMSIEISKDIDHQVIITPWSRVLEELIVSQLVKKFPAHYGT
jgi:hypothetical protein